MSVKEEFFNMIDWLSKEIVDMFYFSDLEEKRDDSKTVKINGRLYEKHGIRCATTAVAILYRVKDPSVEHFKYAVTIGVARQNPRDSYITPEHGFEVAEMKAMLDPSVVLTYDTEVADFRDAIEVMFQAYSYSLPVEFVMTKEEFKQENLDPSRYNRHSPNDAYREYYNDCKKLFYCKR